MSVQDEQARYALGSELARAVDRVKLVDIKRRARSELVGELLAGKPNQYHLYCPPAKKRQEESHLLVQLADEQKFATAQPFLVARFLEGTGFLSGMANPLDGRTAVPLIWLQRGFVLSPGRLKDADRRRASYLVARFNVVRRGTKGGGGNG